MRGLRLALALPMALVSGPAWAQAAELSRMGEKAADSLFDRGVLGIVLVGVVVVAGLLVWWLMGQISDRDEAIALRDQRIETLQEKRASDGVTYATMLAKQTTESAAAIAANTNQLAVWADRVQSVVDLVRPLGPDHARIIASLDRNAEKIDALRTGGRP